MTSSFNLLLLLIKSKHRLGHRTPIFSLDILVLNFNTIYYNEYKCSIVHEIIVFSELSILHQFKYLVIYTIPQIIDISIIMIPINV